MKNRKLLVTKGIHTKKLSNKSFYLPKSAGPGSFTKVNSTVSYARPTYSFSAN